MRALEGRAGIPYSSVFVTVRKRRSAIEILGTLLTIGGVIGGLYFAYVWITYFVVCTWFPYPWWWYPWYWYPWYGTPPYPSMPNACMSTPVTSLILQTIVFAVAPFAIGEWLSGYGHGEQVVAPYTYDPGAPEVSALDQLTKLKALLDSNAITKEEFEVQKRRLLPR